MVTHRPPDLFCNLCDERRVEIAGVAE